MNQQLIRTHPHSPNQMNNRTRNPDQHISVIGNTLVSEALRNRKEQCLAWISQIDRRWFVGGNSGESEADLNQADGDTEESDLSGLHESLAL
jgi:hypothetical protein